VQASWHALFTDPTYPGTLVQGAITSIIWTAIFGGAGWYLPHEWQTGTPGEANVPMDATCNRGAGTGQSTGAGDDWSGEPFINPVYAFDGCFGTP
jgi:hypothetical protein